MASYQVLLACVPQGRKTPVVWTQFLDAASSTDAEREALRLNPHSRVVDVCRAATEAYAVHQAARGVLV